MKKYSENLPEYLQGDNIRRHSEIIEEEDYEINKNVELFSSWAELERPIFIEKVQNSLSSADFNFHINSQFPVERITIAVEDDVYEYTYSEEELVTQTVITKTLPISAEEVVWSKNILVTVETYEDITYKKGYPENDEIQGDAFDHDIYLTRVGEYLGLPRRIYKKWITPAVDVASSLPDTYPPYFAKRDGDEIIAGTEDDYYYYLRLKYFLENKNTFLPVLMMRLLYEWDSFKVLPASNRTTSITDTSIKDKGCIILSNNTNTYINIDDEERQPNITKYDSLTRPPYVTYRHDTTLTVSGFEGGSANNRYISYSLHDDLNNFIDNAPLTIDLWRDRQVVYTDKEMQIGSTNQYKLLFPSPCSKYALGDSVEMVYDGEYEFNRSESVTVTLIFSTDYSYSLSTSEWMYQPYVHSSASVEPPRITGQEYLSIGRGAIVYTPSLLWSWIVNDTENERFVDNIIVVKFNYGSSTNQIGITRVYNADGDQYNWDSRLTLQPRAVHPFYDNTEHQLTYVFTKKYVKIYFDKVFIRQERYNNNRQLLYLAGYNATTESDSNLKGLYIQEAENKIYQPGEYEIGDETIVIMENTQNSFNLNNWRASGTRTIVNKALQLSGVNYSNINLPNLEDWRIHIEMSSTANGNIRYRNDTIGAVQLTFNTNGTTTILERSNITGTDTVTKTTTMQTPFLTNGNAKLTIEKQGNNIIFKYGNEVYTRTYDEITGKGFISIQTTSEGYITLQNMVIIKSTRAEIGTNTSIPFTNEMWSNIMLTSRNESKANKSTGPAIFKDIIFDGDFKLKLNMNTSLKNDWQFGFVTDSTSTDTPLIMIKGTKLGKYTWTGGIIRNPFPNPDPNATEEITLVREGNTYALKFGDNLYTTTGSDAPVCFYMKATNEGSIFISSFEVDEQYAKQVITAEEERWTTSKSADKTNNTFTRAYPFTVTGTGYSPVVEEDGSLRVRSKYATDWMYYQENEDWNISLEIKINNLNSSEMGIATVSGTNGGIWNIHGKWLDYNDSTDTGNVRTQLSNLSYGNGDTIRVKIEKRRDTITWKFIDSNDNKQTVVCTNYEQNIDTRFYMRCSNNDTDIVMNRYERATRNIADTRLTSTLTSETINNLPGTASVQATLTNDDVGIENATILCKNGMTTVTSATTDEDGVATLDLSELESGSYTLTLQFEGDGTYRSTSRTHNITIAWSPLLNHSYGKGQSTPWQSSMWSAIEINSSGEAHCNYLHHPAILKDLRLTGDFILLLHIQVSHNQSWDFGLVPQSTSTSNPVMRVAKGDTLNGESITNMFHTSGVVWDSTVDVRILRMGDSYTLSYNDAHDVYEFTGTTDDVWFYMDKTGSGNIFITYIQTSETM